MLNPNSYRILRKEWNMDSSLRRLFEYKIRSNS